jgi:hypothetical protein
MICAQHIHLLDWFPSQSLFPIRNLRSPVPRRGFLLLRAQPAAHEIGSFYEGAANLAPRCGGLTLRRRRRDGNALLERLSGSLIAGAAVRLMTLLSSRDASITTCLSVAARMATRAGAFRHRHFGLSDGRFLRRQRRMYQRFSDRRQLLRRQRWVYRKRFLFRKIDCLAIA